MNLKASKRGSITVVISIMVAIITAMVIVLIYTNNKEKSNLKQTEIQKETEIYEITKNSKNSDVDTLNKGSDFDSTDRVLEIKYQYFGDLVAVLNNKELKEPVLKENLKGNVKVSYLDNSYLLVASFENLPDFKDNSFYNGWLIKEEDTPSIINTGKAVKVGGVYINAYTSEKDLTDHDVYILSIERNDNIEKPSSNRVLNGEIKLVKEQ
jgi:hypothetical protein